LVSTWLTSVLADPGRLAAVRQTNLLDTPAEDAFDRVARLAARLLEVPIALVPLIEEDRQFFKACVGLPEPWASARQTPLSHSLCQHVVVARQPLAIGDTGRDALARDNPLVRELGLAAYLGVPLIDPSGHALGSVCVADRRPRDWTPEQVAVLTDLAGLVMTQIQLKAELATRGELERRLIDVEASLQALLDRLPGVVYAVGPDSPNSVLYVSPQIQALVGLSAGDCVGDPQLWERLVHPEDREWVLAEDKRCERTGQPWHVEYRVLAKDGRVVWLRDHAVLVRGEHGEPDYWQGYYIDITEQKQAEEALRQALERERQALERERQAARQLRALDELKNTFLDAVSHELRTPLATVIGIALTLQRAGSSLTEEDTADLVDRLVANAGKLDRLLADLLDLDRLSKGILAPQRSRTNLAALVGRVAQEWRQRSGRQLEVVAEPVVAWVDSAKVERVVENLLANAGRHTTPDTPVWVRVARRDEGVLLAVEDAGGGVPRELRATLFEPFRRGPGAAAHAPGVGIGLSVVARFAELHGGRAWVQDRPGGGASFQVLLPDSAEPADVGGHT
jgi:PAS domain S-box-containing protein